MSINCLTIFVGRDCRSLPLFYRSNRYQLTNSNSVHNLCSAEYIVFVKRRFSSILDSLIGSIETTGFTALHNMHNNVDPAKRNNWKGENLLFASSNQNHSDLHGSTRMSVAIPKIHQQQSSLNIQVTNVQVSFTIFCAPYGESRLNPARIGGGGGTHTFMKMASPPDGTDSNMSPPTCPTPACQRHVHFTIHVSKQLHQKLHSAYSTLFQHGTLLYRNIYFPMSTLHTLLKKTYHTKPRQIHQYLISSRGGESYVSPRIGGQASIT